MLSTRLQCADARTLAHPITSEPAAKGLNVPTGGVQDKAELVEDAKALHLDPPASAGVVGDFPSVAAIYLEAIDEGAAVGGGINATIACHKPDSSSNPSHGLSVAPNVGPKPSRKAKTCPRQRVWRQAATCRILPRSMPTASLEPLPHRSPTVTTCRRYCTVRLGGTA